MSWIFLTKKHNVRI